MYLFNRLDVYIGDRFCRKFFFYFKFWSVFGEGYVVFFLVVFEVEDRVWDVFVNLLFIMWVSVVFRILFVF